MLISLVLLFYGPGKLTALNLDSIQQDTGRPIVMVLRREL
ncbi:MAG: hypothetical protein ACI9A2_003654, partial [Halioglobus sp.]